MANKRRHKRHSYGVGVTVRLAERPEHSYSAFIRNISAGGLFVETEKSWDVGTVLQLTFVLPVRPYVLTCQGSVRWRHSGQPLPSSPGDTTTAAAATDTPLRDQVSGVGVQLESLDPEAATLLKAVLSKLEDEGPEE